MAKEKYVYDEKVEADKRKAFSNNLKKAVFSEYVIEDDDGNSARIYSKDNIITETLIREITAYKNIKFIAVAYNGKISPRIYTLVQRVE